MWLIIYYTWILQNCQCIMSYHIRQLTFCIKHVYLPYSLCDPAISMPQLGIIAHHYHTFSICGLSSSSSPCLAVDYHALQSYPEYMTWDFYYQGIFSTRAHMKCQKLLCSIRCTPFLKPVDRQAHRYTFKLLVQTLYLQILNAFFPNYSQLPGNLNL